MNLKNGILMNRIIFFMSCMFFFGSSFGYCASNYCKILDCVVTSYCKEFVNSRRMILSGYGGEMMDDIQKVTLRFLSNDSLNVEQARILYVELMEEFLQRLNSCKKIRLYLHEFPFRIDNVRLTIAFENNERNITQDGHTALMYIGKNCELLFRGYNPETEEFYSLNRERYEVARKIVLGY